MTRNSHSRHWKDRRQADGYIKRAHKEGVENRAYYKLAQLDKQFGIFGKKGTIIELGASPGGWSQYILTHYPSLILISVDVIASVSRSENHQMIVGDMLQKEVMDSVASYCEEFSAAVILSDAAPNLSGIRENDQLRGQELLDGVESYANRFLKNNGNLLYKYFDSDDSEIRIKRLKNSFLKAKKAKPEASRSSSSERYFVGMSFAQKE